MGAIRFLVGNASVFRREIGEVEREETRERLRSPIGAVRVYMSANLEALIVIGGGL
jgi:hypothetical protein